MAAVPSAALDESQLVQVLFFLAPRGTVRLQQTSKTSSFSKVATRNAVWAKHLTRVFALEGDATAPAGEDCGGSSQRAFGLWAALAKDAGIQCVDDTPIWKGFARGARPSAWRSPAVCDLPISTDWVNVCARMCRWLQPNAPSVLEGFRPPVTETEALLPLLDAQGIKLTSKVLDLWRIFDGQAGRILDKHLAELLGMDVMESEDDFAQGIFGGYAAYRHEISSIMLPLTAALTLTAFLQERIPALREHHRTKMVFANSYNFDKIFLVDTQDLGVYIWTRRQDPLLERAAPCNVENPFLAWVVEYVKRLETGVYTMRALRPEKAPATTGICLFPTDGSGYSRCVTRGVEVVASCIYMPESPQGWTYSISFSLVDSVGERERGYKTCQLKSRQWEIQEDGRSAPETVNGEGVIGFFPILTDGGWVLNRESDPHDQYYREPGFVQGAFQYQSCAGRLPSMKGSFGGTLTFIPGTINKPTGPPFQVKLEPFRLERADYLY
mmetsp:Transcript_27327/g.62992  ORF Transcript_27327/g.62992 Transcript_27327/m.62992 type:complete len:497 (-) Transcript_27327:120-1610(-)